MLKLSPSISKKYPSNLCVIAFSEFPRGAFYFENQKQKNLIVLPHASPSLSLLVQRVCHQSIFGKSHFASSDKKALYKSSPPSAEGTLFRYQVTVMDLSTFNKENYERIKAVESSFGASGRPLSKPGRVLVGRGCLMKQGRRKPQPKVFFLFNDVLVYGSIIVNGRWYKKMKIIPLGKQLIYLITLNHRFFIKYDQMLLVKWLFKVAVIEKQRNLTHWTCHWTIHKLFYIVFIMPSSLSFKRTSRWRTWRMVWK